MDLTVLPPKDKIIERCLQGDNQGFKILYEQYCKAMFNTCLRILNNRPEAEDVLQESFTEAFKNLERFEHRSSFGSWLKKICINRCINQLKKRRAALLELQDGDELLVEEVQEDDIAYSVERVKKAIVSLPDGYRAVLTLYLLEGYDHGEIAEILHVAESTVRTQYTRARKKLIELLK